MALQQASPLTPLDPHQAMFELFWAFWILDFSARIFEARPTVATELCKWLVLGSIVAGLGFGVVMASRRETQLHHVRQAAHVTGTFFENLKVLRRPVFQILSDSVIASSAPVIALIIVCLTSWNITPMYDGTIVPIQYFLLGLLVFPLATIIQIYQALR